jgi:hypothetical protein
LRKPQPPNIREGYNVIKILKQGMIASLLAASSATAPAAAQAGTDGQQIRTRTSGVPVRVPSNRPVQSTEPDKLKQGPPEVSQVKVPKSIKAAYYCTIEITLSSMGKVGAPQQRQFTISALDDGTLVYGGKDPLDSQRRFSLVDEGEWRAMIFVGWIEGYGPPNPASQGISSPWASKWSITPRVHRDTGEFSARSSVRFGPITETSTYSGSCSGGV